MDVLVPGGRDVRGTLDGPEDASRAVVACPPHPQHGGSRTDARLRAVADELADRGVACLRFDYGPWDEGRGERADAENAVGWARERFDRVALFGYSFGGAVAVLAAPRTDVAAVSALAPGSRITADLDAVAALDDLDCPLQVVYGSRDDTADWRPLVERARELDATVVEYPADHFFVGQQARVGADVAAFLAERL